ncbi:hypothetical protein ABZ611_13570 [Streptomyces sp. NPDC007861]|uniref:hypothetical protein n=1 Tax=Streptomyces sp. NPDC007861 TaxID=3154893 RepID=UPI0033EF4855
MDSVTKAPAVPDGKVIAAVENGSGSKVLELQGGFSSGNLAVAVNCEGKGTLQVTLEPVGLSFPMKCKDGEVFSTYNQFALKRARQEASVSVQASSKVRWSMTVAQ